MRKSILILGGSGFVSGRLCRMALERGMDVTCLTRGNRPLPEGAHALTADRGDREQLKAALEKADRRYDCVMDCICFNAEQARIALDVLPAFTERIAVISTDSVYRPDRKTVPQAEDEFADLYLNDGGYGAEKRKMEEVYLSGNSPLRWTIFRPGHIYGTGSKLGCYPELSRRDGLLDIIAREEPLPLVGGGSFLIQPIYVDDLCRVMLDCIDNPLCCDRLFCIGGPDVIPNAEYYRILGRLTGHPVTVRSIPLEGYLEAHPEYSGHLCNRSYDLTRLRLTGIRLPDTHLIDGLRTQLRDTGVIA